MTRISVLGKHFKHMLYVCYCSPYRTSSSPCIWGSHHWEMQNCTASSTHPAPPYRESGLLEVRHWKGTLNINIKFKGPNPRQRWGRKQRNLPISFQEYPFKEDIHHAFYLCPFLLQLYEEQHGTNETALVHCRALRSGTSLTSVIFRCIFSSCSGLFCLVVFVLCTSYSFWLFSMLTCRLRLTPTRALTNFSADQGCPKYPLVSWMQLNFSTCSMIYLLVCRCVWRPV